jgi:hypothetical protein
MFYINLDLNTKEKYNPINFLNIQDFDVYDTINSYMFYYIPLLPLYKTYRVTVEEGRPDLISYEVYKDTQYWWVILLYNSLCSVNEVKKGMMLGYPLLEDIEQLYLNAVSQKKTIKDE